MASRQPIGHPARTAVAVSIARRCSQCRSQRQYRQRSSPSHPSVLPSKCLSKPKAKRSQAAFHESARGILAAMVDRARCGPTPDGARHATPGGKNRSAKVDQSPLAKMHVKFKLGIAIANGGRLVCSAMVFFVKPQSRIGRAEMKEGGAESIASSVVLTSLTSGS